MNDALPVQAPSPSRDARRHQAIKDRDRHLLATVQLPYGHTVLAHRVTRRSYWLLTRGLDGYPAVHRGAFEAVRKAGHTGGSRFDPVPDPVTPRSVHFRALPPEWHARLILPGDRAHPLDALQDALSRMAHAAYAPLKLAVALQTAAHPGDDARELSRRLRERRHAATQLNTPGSVWTLWGDGYVLTDPGTPGFFPRFAPYPGDGVPRTMVPEDVRVYGYCLTPPP